MNRFTTVIALGVTVATLLGASAAYATPPRRKRTDRLPPVAKRRADKGRNPHDQAGRLGQAVGHSSASPSGSRGSGLVGRRTLDCVRARSRRLLGHASA